MDKDNYDLPSLAQESKHYNQGHFKGKKDQSQITGVDDKQGFNSKNSQDLKRKSQKHKGEDFIKGSANLATSSTYKSNYQLANEGKTRNDDEYEVISNLLYVKGLPKNITEAKLEQLFSPFGPILKIKLIANNPEFKTAIAHIHYKMDESAEKAIEKGVMIEDYSVNISKARVKKGKETEKERETNTRFDSQKSFNPQNSRNKNFNTKENLKSNAIIQEENKEGKRDQDDHAVMPNVLYVKSLPKDITEKEIEQLFSPFGTIFKIKLDPAKSEFKTVAARVYFLNEESADSAIKAEITFGKFSIKVDKVRIKNAREAEMTVEDFLNKPMSFHDAENHYLYFLSLLKYFCNHLDVETVLAVSQVIRAISTKPQSNDIYVAAVRRLACKAAEGIIAEGRTLGDQTSAANLSQKLMSLGQTSSSTVDAIFNEAVYLYTTGSFLYRTVNYKLRERKDLWNLSSYCILLCAAISCYRYTGKVFRGMNLSEDTLAEYNVEKSKYFSWNSFTSVSKSEGVSKGFGNAFFEIDIEGSGNLWDSAIAMDIARCSAYPGEQEILISAGAVFEIVDHTVNANQSHHIKLKTVTGKSWSIIGYEKRRTQDKPEERLVTFLAQDMITDGFILPAMSFFKGTYLKIVHLLYNRITDSGALQISNSLSQTSIEWLNLGFNEMSDVGLVNLIKGSKGSRLLQLDVKGNCITDQGIAEASKILGETNITILDIGNNNVSDYGITELFKNIQQAPKLKELFASCSNITDIGAKAIATYLPNTNLYKLYLGANCITDQGVEHLSTAIKKINFLHLNNNLITDRGAQAIIRTLPELQFKVLNLSMNQLTDVIMKDLAKSLENKEIYAVDLGYNRITIAGSQLFLENLSPTTKLKQLDLKYNLIRHEDKAQLQEKCNLKRIELRINKHA